MSKSSKERRKQPANRPSGGATARKVNVAQILATTAEPNRGPLQAAEAVYRQAIQAWPENAEAWHRLGVLYAQANHLDRAITCLDRACALESDNPIYLCDLGNAYMAGGRQPEAEERYRAALDLDPNHREARFNLGNAYFSEQRFREASEEYKIAAEHGPGDPLVHTRLGIALYRLMRFDDAVATLRRALDIDPHFADAQYNLGLAYSAQGHLDLAVKAYRQALKVDPGRADAQLDLGKALYELGKGKHALASFRHAAELDSGLAEAHACVGEVLHEQGDLEAAAAALRQALEIDPNLTQGYVNLGLTLRALGDPKWAARAFEQALQVRPGDPRALAHLTIALQEADQEGDAEALLAFDRLLVRETLGSVEGWPDIPALNEALARFVATHPSLLDERPGKHLINGAQTLDLLFEQNPAIAALRGEIETRVRAYIEDRLMRADTPYELSLPESWRLSGWGTVLRSGGHQTPHCRPKGFVSGVYFVQVPDIVVSGSGDAGCLEFGTPPHALAEDDDPEHYLVKTVRPAEGNMLLFPSYYWQNAKTFEDPQDLIWIGFDVVPG